LLFSEGRGTKSYTALKTVNLCCHSAHVDGSVYYKRLSVCGLSRGMTVERHTSSQVHVRHNVSVTSSSHGQSQRRQQGTANHIFSSHSFSVRWKKTTET